MPAIRSGRQPAAAPAGDVPAGEPLVPINKVPELRNLSPVTRWRLALRGELACTRIGRRLFTTASAVRSFLDARRVVPAPKGAPAASRKRDAQKAAATAAARAELGITDATDTAPAPG